MKRAPRRRFRVIAVASALAAGLLLARLPAGARGPEAPPSGTRSIDVTAKAVPLDTSAPEQTRFGKLDWLGTLELTAASPHFGGYSGLALDAAGTRLLAVSDVGSWLEAEIVGADGRMTGLSHARIGSLRGRDGKPLATKPDQDAEAIAMAEPGTTRGRAYIAFERNHRIGVFAVTDAGPGAPERELPLPGGIEDADANGGIEALAVLRAGPARGALLALTEKHVDDQGNHVGWLIGGPEPGALALKRIGGFAVTDMTVLPGGDVVVLERRFRFTEGVKMRLRRIVADTIRPGALLEGTVLFQTDARRAIDNMEGIAAHKGPDGRTVLTIVSDDNFNTAFQRTLLMRFALPGDD